MSMSNSESILSHHGVHTGTGRPSFASTDHADVDEVKHIIKQFLEDTQFDRTTPFAKDRKLEAAVWNYITDLDMRKEIEDAVLPNLKIGVTYTQQTYTFLPFEIRVCCAIMFLYMFLVDDITDGFMEDLEAFNQNFVLNKRHGHPLLAAFDIHLRGLSRYYGHYCHSAIIKSAMDYVNGRVIEHKMHECRFKFPSSSELMPIFLRHKVGGAEIMIHMCFPENQFPEAKYVLKYFPIIQELVDFVDFTNDILSYYKEFILADEKGNFVSNYAETHHLRQVDVLRHFASHAPHLIHSVYRMLEKKEELLPVVKIFFSGVILLFTAHRRYHLVELFADEQYLPAYDEDA